MHDHWTIVESVLGVFLVIAVGAVIRQLGWLHRDSDKSLAKLISNVLLPAYFLQKILFADSHQIGSEALIPPLWGFLFTSSCFVWALFLARRFGSRIGLKSDSSKRAFALCVGICNFGFIPLPLAERYYPDAVVDLILHNVGVNLALWSVGLAVIQGTVRGGIRAAFLSPPFLSVFLAIIIKLQFGAEVVPSFMGTAIESLGACAIPLGLILSGAIMVDFLREATWRGSVSMVLAAISLRQVVFPALMIVLGTLLSVDRTMRQIILLQAAMPAAIFPIVIVKLYDHDLETATRVVVASSVLGVITIPIWLTVGVGWIVN